MSPRKRPMAAGKPLKRSQLRRRALLRATERRRRETGPTVTVRRIVLERAGGRCELCGTNLATIWCGYSLHHRSPRGMGGSRSDHVNRPSSLLAVCGSGTSGCHGLVESQRQLALANGWLVPHGEMPAEIPVELHRGLVYLDDSGECVEGSP